MTTLCIPVLELLIQAELWDEIKVYVEIRAKVWIAVTVHRQIGVRDIDVNAFNLFGTTEHILM